MMYLYIYIYIASCGKILQNQKLTKLDACKIGLDVYDIMYIYTRPMDTHKIRSLENKCKLIYVKHRNETIIL